MVDIPSCLTCKYGSSVPYPTGRCERCDIGWSEWEPQEAASVSTADLMVDPYRQPDGELRRAPPVAEDFVADEGLQDLQSSGHGGIKHDNGKPRMSLMPTAPLVEVAKVLTFGAEKYAPHNWRKGFNYSRLADAALRHLLAFNEGEDTDPESGLPHLAHASCCLLFLLEHQVRGLGTDDRFKP